VYLVVVCRCGHEDEFHAFDEPTVCKDVNCKCVKYISATVEMPVISEIDKYMDQFQTMHDKMKWVLENWKWFRNYTNKDLIFAWYRFINNWNPKKSILTDEIFKRLDDPETIRRSKQKVVESDYNKYGPYLPSTIQEHKILKQYAIEQWIVEH
jgi:hypothetical protein